MLALFQHSTSAAQAAGLYEEQRPLPLSPALEATTKPTIRPYRPKASAKMRIRIMPTKRRGWGVGTDTCITHNANGKSGSQGGEADSESSTKVGIARVCGVFVCWLNVTIDDDSSDEAVDTQDTSHDNRNDGA